MTIIIGYNDKKNKEILLASDRQATRGKEPIPNSTKIFSKKLEIVDDKKQIIETQEIWFGHSGLATNSNYMNYAFKLPQKNVNETIEEYLIKKLIKEFTDELIDNKLVKVKEGKISSNSWFLIVIDNKIYRMSNNGMFYQDTDYVVLGCGEELALGALYVLEGSDLTATDKVKKAIECVDNYDIYCNSNYDIKKIPYAGEIR